MCTTTGVFKTGIKWGLRVFICEPGWKHMESVGVLMFVGESVPTVEALERMVKENEGYEISGAMKCELGDGKKFGLLVSRWGIVERVDF